MSSNTASVWIIAILVGAPAITAISRHWAARSQQQPKDGQK
jgi:hypothetical protein